MIVLVVKVTRQLVVEDGFMVVLDHMTAIRRVCGRQSCSCTDCHKVRAKSVTFSCVYVKMQEKIYMPNGTVFAFVRCLTCS